MGLPAFKNASLLIRGLTHRSFVNEHPEAGEDNERLEFLGDSVLDFVAASFLYHRFPALPEGGLTRLRAALVCAPQLAAFAREIDIGAVLRLGRGEEENGGRTRTNLLSNAFEAVMGAYFLDSGLQAVKTFVEPMYERAVDEILLADKDVDAKSLFQEWAQSELGETPRYNTIATEGPDHNRTYTVEVVVAGKTYGQGQGPNKQVAQQVAASSALQQLGLL
jgi:ribonuclease III